jgi:hypothetical protein
MAGFGLGVDVLRQAPVERPYLQGAFEGARCGANLLNVGRSTLRRALFAQPFVSKHYAVSGEFASAAGSRVGRTRDTTKPQIPHLSLHRARRPTCLILEGV